MLYLVSQTGLTGQLCRFQCPDAREVLCDRQLRCLSRQACSLSALIRPKNLTLPREGRSEDAAQQLCRSPVNKILLGASGARESASGARWSHQGLGAFPSRFLIKAAIRLLFWV